MTIDVIYGRDVGGGGVTLLPSLFFGRSPSGSAWWVYIMFWRGRIGLKVRA